MKCLLVLTIFFARSLVLAACPSPFAVAASEHFWFQDRDLFQLYDSEIRDLKKNNADQKALSIAIQAKNIEALSEFSTSSMNFDPFDPQSTLPSKSQAQKILKELRSNPVIGDTAQGHYDATAETGFCFGRAAFVHFALLKLGVKPEHISKIFVMGGLYRDGTGWDYHVATAALGAEGQWWVIDSLVDDVLPLQAWMQQVSKWDGNRINPRIRYYFTAATKFQPIYGTYEAPRLRSPIYKGYFENLAAWYANNTCQK